MASKKVTITLSEELLEELALAAQASGISVSRLIAMATEQDLRRRAGLQAMTEWQQEHGPFTPEELARARAEAAAADADLIDGLGRAGAEGRGVA